MSNEKPALVLDNGSGVIKCGFAGANFPSTTFTTVVGRPVIRSSKKSYDAVNGKELKPVMIGDETNGVRHMLEVSYPVRNGVIQNMDDMCLIWDYAFSNKMNIDPSEHKVLMSEAPACSRKHRTQLHEVMFETYGVPAMQTSIQGVLSLFSAGFQTGVAVDSGEGVTHCMPVFESYSIPKAVRRVDLGGRNVTEYLIRLLQRRGYTFNRSADFETVRAIKEMFCYAAVDFEIEKKLALETTVLEKAMTLPDGNQCRIGRERFEATECLFSPGLIDVECDGLSTQLWNSINAADIDVRAKLYEHIVLSGGSTMFPGLPSRVEKDIRGMYLEKALKGDISRLGKFPLRIEDPPRRKHMVFIGGAVMAELCQGMEEQWITREQFAEQGEGVLRAHYGY